MSSFYTINGSVCTTQNIACIFNDPLNPLNLPPNIVRVRTRDGLPPTKHEHYNVTYETATLVDGTTDVYDVYKSGTNFDNLLFMCDNVIEVLGANTTNVTSTRYMFSDCSALSALSLFDTRSVTNIDDMFDACKAITSVPVYNTINVTSMYGTFYGCSSLTTIPEIDTSNVTNMHTMFMRCYGLTTAPMLNTSSVTSMEGMFSKCSALTSVPVYNTSNVTNFGSMFVECSSLSSAPLFDTHNATSFSYMFQTCTALSAIPDYDTTNLQYIIHMCDSCSSLTAINLFDTTNVQKTDWAFYNCVNVQSGASALYQQLSTQANPPSTHYRTFLNCGTNTVQGAAELAQIPNDWK